MTCSRDDHDTTDPFCGACGLPVDIPDDHCPDCLRGHHVPGTPFCRCCGEGLQGQGRWTIFQGVRNRLRRVFSIGPIADWGLTEDEKGR